MLIYVLTVGMFAICGLLVYSVLAPEQPMPSPYDLDRQACQQMRDSGWTEQEIVEFCSEHEMYYDRG